MHYFSAFGEVAAEWRDGILISLYKGKGPKDECESYRPISLLSVRAKYLLICCSNVSEALVAVHTSGHSNQRLLLDVARLVGWLIGV